MNRQLKRQFLRRAVKLTAEEQNGLAMHYAANFWTGPLTEFEAEIGRHISESFRCWYHGAGPGMRVGTVLKPARETGLDPRNHGAGSPDRLAAVFITPKLLVARHYAALAHGPVCRVDPIGDLSFDPTELRAFRLLFSLGEWGELSGFLSESEFLNAVGPELSGFTCQSAVVLEVLQ